MKEPVYKLMHIKSNYGDSRVFKILKDEKELIKIELYFTEYTTNIKWTAEIFINGESAEKNIGYEYHSSWEGIKAVQSALKYWLNEYDIIYVRPLVGKRMKSIPKGNMPTKDVSEKSPNQENKSVNRHKDDYTEVFIVNRVHPIGSPNRIIKI